MHSTKINATKPQDSVQEKGAGCRASTVLQFVKSKNRAWVKARTSVQALANKSKWKQTNPEAKVQAKVRGTV